MEIEYKLNKEDYNVYVNALTRAYIGLISNIFGFIQGIFGGIMIVIFITLAMNGHYTSVSIILIGIFVSYILLIIATRIAMRRKFSPGIGSAYEGPWTLTADPDSLTVETKGIFHRMDWNVIDAFIETKRHLVLHSDDKYAITIPKSAFVDDVQLGQFRNFYSGKVISLPIR